MKFLIIGGGNLGLDLWERVLRIPGEHKIIYSSQSEVEFRPDIMIYTPGGGITEPWARVHKKNFIDLVHYGEKYSPKKTFVFSSNAAREPNLSAYAFAKLTMENICKDTDSIFAIRVNSLYGTHKPEKCFPNKLIQKYRYVESHGVLQPVTLPENPIVPTPTKWLAEKVIEYILDTPSHHKVFSIAPRGQTTPLEWGRIILGDKYETKSSGMADDRPTIPFVSTVDYGETWLELWKKYGPTQIGKSSRG